MSWSTIGWKNLGLSIPFEKYEADLAHEIGHHRVRLKPSATFQPELYFFSKRSASKVQRQIWAQNMWMDLEYLTFDSVGQATRLLKERGGRWSHYPTQWHRRAALIQAGLPKIRFAPLDLTDAFPQRPMGSWCLLSANEILCSKECTSPLPNGNLQLVEDKTAPSRAYSKLHEIFIRTQLRPEKHDICLDLGSSPGGWTHVLRRLQCQVYSFDRAPLAEDLMKDPKVTHKIADAFALKPKRYAPEGKSQWLFSDLACFPADAFELIERWSKAQCADRFVCSIKLTNDFNSKDLKQFEKIEGSHLIHLLHNKHELTWFKLQD